MADGSALLAAVDGLVHEPTQVTDRGIDLTVAAIYDHVGPGRVDFGGGELAPAETSPHPTQRRNPDDDYAWWHLDAGGYLLEYNERIDAEATFWLQPRRALAERGASHPTRRVDALGPVPLFVADGGLRLKENARVSTLLARS